MTLRLVIFDMDDVLCQYDLGRRLRALSRLSGRTPRDIRAAIWDSGFEDAADSGAYSESEYLAQFGERLGYPITRAEWAEARRGSMTAWEEMLGLARAIATRADIALYTNNGPLTRATLPELFPAAHALFGERAFFSYQFGTKKPDPESYRRLLAHLGVRPEDSFFIDDKLSNVEGARIAGLHAHHFRSREAFEDEARELGLLSPQ